MYDNTCKFLAETFPTDFATWLLGKPIALTKLEPSELSSEPIRADSVIFLGSSEVILHLEFQTTTDKNMAFRMLDYWVRLHRKYPDTQIYQTVIYLKPTDSALVYQSSFDLSSNQSQTKHTFNVIRLWEQDVAIFQEYSGLLPFAALAQTPDPEQTLRQVANRIANIKDKLIQSNVSAATYIISGLALDKEIIQRLLRKEIMKESVTYQEILLEGMTEGKAQGMTEGKAEGMAQGKAEGMAEIKNQIALNMLRSDISIDLIAQFTGLSTEQIQQLGGNL
jgi:predicted transposase/invertase (TIGR01784 family)